MTDTVPYESPPASSSSASPTTVSGDAVAARSTGRRWLPRWLPPVLLGAFLLAFWQVWVSVRHIEPFVLPTPARIVRAGWQSASLLPHHVWATVVASMAGLVAGAVAGVVLAVLIVRVRVIRQVLYPLLVVSQTIPMVVLAPLLIIWFGFGLTPRIVVVALIVFFPVLVSIVTAIDQADADLIDLVRSMGAAPRQVLRLILLPSAVPAFFSGLRIAAAYTVGGAVIAEFVNPNGGGLGVFITRSRQAYAVDRIFVAVVIIGLLTALLFAAVDLAGATGLAMATLGTHHPPVPSPISQRGACFARGPAMTRSLKRRPPSTRLWLQRTVGVAVVVLSGRRGLSLRQREQHEISRRSGQGHGGPRLDTEHEPRRHLPGTREGLVPRGRAGREDRRTGRYAVARDPRCGEGGRGAQRARGAGPGAGQGTPGRVDRGDHPAQHVEPAVVAVRRDLEARRPRRSHLRRVRRAAGEGAGQDA